MGRVDDAIDVYNRVIQIYPINKTKYYRLLGELYKLKGKNELAINAFNQVLNIDQTDYETRLDLASLYEANGDFSSALEQYQCSLKYTKILLKIPE